MDTEHTHAPDTETTDVDRERIETLVNEGREEELSEAEYQYAIENGLIEG